MLRKAIQAQVAAEVLANFVEGKVEEPELGIRGEVYKVSVRGEMW